jgi:hypothetical protein
VGRACGTHRKERCESLKERHHSEDKGVDGKMGSQWILSRLAGVVWIQLAQDRDQWQAVVNMVMYLLVLARQSLNRRHIRKPN